MSNLLEIRGWLRASRTTYVPILSSFLAVFIATSSFASAEAIETITVHEGLKQGYLRVDATSKGSSSARCVNLSLKNVHSKTLEVLVPSGTLLTVNDFQDILVTRDEVLVLQPRQSLNRDLYGFCTQPSESTPTEQTKFDVVEGSSVWKELAALLQKENLDPGTEQSVVWACTEEFPLSGVRLVRGDQTALTALIERERGQSIPFYEADYGELLDRPFQNELLEVSGAMVHTTAQHGKASLIVYDPDGNVVYNIFEEKRLQADATYTFRFRIMGSYLPEGEYKMVLTIGTEEARVERIVV